MPSGLCASRSRSIMRPSVRSLPRSGSARSSAVTVPSLRLRFGAPSPFVSRATGLFGGSLGVVHGGLLRRSLGFCRSQNVWRRPQFTATPVQSRPHEPPSPAPADPGARAPSCCPAMTSCFATYGACCTTAIAPSRPHATHCSVSRRPAARSSSCRTRPSQPRAWRACSTARGVPREAYDGYRRLRRDRAAPHCRAGLQAHLLHRPRRSGCA